MLLQIRFDKGSTGRCEDRKRRCDDFPRRTLRVHARLAAASAQPDMGIAQVSRRSAHRCHFAENVRVSNRRLWFRCNFTSDDISRTDMTKHKTFVPFRSEASRGTGILIGTMCLNVSDNAKSASARTKSKFAQQCRQRWLEGCLRFRETIFGRSVAMTSRWMAGVERTSRW